MPLNSNFRLKNGPGKIMRLNGWQRIEVVLSILWTIGAAIYVRSTQVENANSLFQMEYNACVNHNQQSTTIKSCLDKVSFQNAIDVTANWLDVAFFAFAPVIAGWLIAYIALKTFLWVKVGFSKKS
jgi:hypothetical protein